MDKISLIIVVVIVFLIYRQFTPKEVNRFDLLGLPILALYKTYSSLPSTLNAVMLIELIILLVLGMIIGYMQGSKTKVMYRDHKLCTVGGMHYLIGVLILIIGRLIIIFIFNVTSIMNAIKNGEESIFATIGHFVLGSGDWILWSTIAASTIIYTITLYKNHPEIRDYIKNQLKS